MLYYTRMDSPVGELHLAADEQNFRYLSWQPPDPSAQFAVQQNGILDAAIWELTQYFRGELKQFSVPVAFSGTEFQIRVWKALQRIPYGETRSYGEIAHAIGNLKACRAVGSANHQNPISIIVPCHRVVGSNGSLTGFGGGLKQKEFLLNLEKHYA